MALPSRLYLSNLLQTLSAPTSSLLYVLCILVLICFYMGRRSRQLQGSYTSAVNTYSNKIVLQQSYVSNADRFCHSIRNAQSEQCESDFQIYAVLTQNI